MGKAAAVRSDEDSNQEANAVHAWRVGRLTGLGVALLVAEAVADRVDWHEVATLVLRGCPASPAVAIVV
jgi:hypothetical protein